MSKFIYLDDIREVPSKEWKLVVSYEECIEEMSAGEFSKISLDHDLSDAHYAGNQKERTGFHVLLWMAENNVWPTEDLVIHTANPVGRKNMLDLVQSEAPKNIRVHVVFPGNNSLYKVFETKEEK